MFSAVLVSLAAGCVEPDTGDEAFDDESSIDSELRINARVEIKSTINTAGAGLCLDIANGNTTIGTPIVQFPCHRGRNQQWQIVNGSLNDFQIVSMLDPTRCVGFTGNAVDHQLLRLAACIDANLVKPLATRFRLDSSDLLQDVSTTAFRSVVTPGTKCIDVASGSNIHSLWMQLYQCHNGPNQKWKLTNW